MNRLVLIGLWGIIAITSLFAATALGGARLGLAAKQAATVFKASVGSTIDQAVTNLIVKSTEDGQGANVSVTYKEQGIVTTKELVCTLAGNDFDCGAVSSGELEGGFIAKKWGAVQLGESAAYAGEKFKEEQGNDGSVTSISVKKNSQGIAAKAIVSYDNGTGVQTVEYFCHEHGTEIDCH